MKKHIIYSLIIFISTGSLVMSQDEASEEPKKEEAVPLETTNLANQLLDDILNLHTLFYRQMSSPDVSDLITGRIKRWQRKGELKVPPNTEWSAFKFLIFKLGSQLAQIKGNKQFIDELRKNHDTYNALKKLHESLGKVKGNVQISAQKKEKVQKFLNSLKIYAHQLYTNKLLEKTNAILAKMPPEKPTPSEAPYEPFEPSYESFDSSFEPYPSDIGFDDFGGGADFDAGFGDGFDFDLGSDFDFDLDAF